MNLSNEFQPVRDWANERGLIEKGNIVTQCVKLQEEVGELAKAIINNDRSEIADAIGDCVVVLTNLAAIEGMNIESCVNEAYSVIKNRTGKMENGSFIKD